ncbi:MAG: hypothetical protein QXM24_05200 [Saccharolobus sp.]
MSYETEKIRSDYNEKKDTIPDLKFDTAEMLTKKDTGKHILITTILNTIITGTLIKTSPYQIEIELNNKDHIIIFKQAIMTVKLYNKKP